MHLWWEQVLPGWDLIRDCKRPVWLPNVEPSVQLTSLDQEQLSLKLPEPSMAQSTCLRWVPIGPVQTKTITNTKILRGTQRQRQTQIGFSATSVWCLQACVSVELLAPLLRPCLCSEKDHSAGPASVRCPTNSPAKRSHQYSTFLLTEFA